MAEKKTTKSEKVEREYVIPLREKCRSVPRYKKTPKAVKTVKQFLVRHMQIRDRDLNKIKIDPLLNEMLWFKGIKNPPHKIKVKAIKDGDIVKVEAVELMKNLEFKKKRLDKRETKAKEVLESKKSMMQKAKEQMQAPKEKKEDKDADGVDDKVEEKEKQKSVEAAAEKQAKEQAKKEKHMTKPKPLKQKSAETKAYNQQSRGR
ncbi:MAG: 60S ribosomal protein L31 [Nanoarchaeota archaeon]|nr:60S ribosomal protein L31 [Nanoarchaeota archaeon]